MENTEESIEKLLKTTREFSKWQISSVEELYEEKFEHPFEECIKI